MKAAGYLAIAIAAVLLSIGLVHGYQNYFELRSSTAAAAAIQPCVDANIDASKCSESTPSAPGDGELALVGLAFLVAGVAMARHPSPKPSREARKPSLSISPR